MKRIIISFLCLMTAMVTMQAQVSIQNPVLWSDVPDPDVICVDGEYYMVSTTAHFMPGAPIMHSRDMKHWEIVSYVFDSLDESAADNLEGGNIYSRGQWAASLRYHNGKFYVFFGTGGYSYLYKADSAAGPWTLVKRFGRYYHDSSMLFDDDGTVWLVHCEAATIYAKKFTADLTDFVDGAGEGSALFTLSDGNLHEGVHAYKIDGRYYMTTIWWPSGGIRTQLCFRSNTMTGVYEHRTILSDDAGHIGRGVAQGGLWQAPNGEWYTMLFQDHEAVGRIPYLLPCRWVDGWPMLGDTSGKTPMQFDIDGITEQPLDHHIAESDDFNGTLSLVWQWNHNPDNSLWSLSERQGWLRLKTGKVVSSLFDARNTLTQRTEGPACTGTVKMDVSQMKDGDRAGMMMFCSEPGGLCVEQSGTTRSLVMYDRSTAVSRITLINDVVWLRAECDFTSDDARFSYSTDGTTFTPLGNRFHMVYTLVHFVGNRFALFNYATKAAGGYVDIDEFIYSTPDDDLSGFIHNPSFELGLDGWTNDGFQAQGNSAFTLKQGNTYAERWVPRGQKVGSTTLSQRLNGLPHGRYILHFYAQNIQEDTPSAAQTGFTVSAEAQRIAVTTAQAYELPFTAIEDNSPLTIQADNATGNWLAIDHFRLTYLGTDPDAEMAEMQRRIDEGTALVERRMNQTMLTQLQTYIERAQNATATTFSTEAAGLRLAINAAILSADAYQRLADAIATAEEALQSGEWTEGLDQLQEAIERARLVYEQDRAANATLDAETQHIEGALLVLRLSNGTGTPPVVTTDPRYARGNNRIFARMTASGSNIIEEGFCYSTDRLPTVADGRATRWIDSGGRIYVIENLRPGTIYYIRAYAITSTDNVGYGDVVKAVTIPSSDISWFYENNGNADENARINAAMQGWYTYWSQLTSIRGYRPHVRFASGTPTADCSYGGWCQVGPNANFQQQCMLTHEMLHGIGVGTHGIWKYGDGGMRAGGNRGVWLGERVTNVLTFWNNAYTVLDGDDTHMWPWGFNYSSEDPHTEAGYTINALVAQALGEDGLPPSGGSPTPYYAFEQEDGRKYYLTNENADCGLGTAYLAQLRNGSLAWSTATVREALENDSLAWYITFNPQTSLYSLRNAATGRYLVCNSSTFTLQTSSTGVPATGYFQLMRGRIDAIIRNTQGEFPGRGFWIVHQEGRYDSPCLAAIAGGSVRTEGFDLGNWATTQRWLIFSTQQMLQMAEPEETADNSRITAIKVNNEPIADFESDVYDYTYEIDPDNILSRYALSVDRNPLYEGTVRSQRPREIPADGTVTCTDPDGTELVYTLHFLPNYAFHWAADGRTGIGSEPNHYGWGPRYTTTWYPANSGTENLYLDPYEGPYTGFVDADNDNHAYRHRRLLLLRWNAGATDTPFTYTLRGLAPDSTYLVQMRLAWLDATRAPQVTATFAATDTGESLGGAEVTLPMAKKQLTTLRFVVRTPADATTDTPYSLQLLQNRTSCTLTLADLIVTPTDEEPIPTDISEVQSTKYDAQSTIYDLQGRRIADQALRPGIYIIDGRKVLIRSSKP